jgi:hypothetical protein
MMPWRRLIVRAAIELADEGGIKSLSMRKLSQALGGAAMSLYNHVSDKDDLVDGMIDAMFSEVELPVGEVDWKTSMRERAISMRNVMIDIPGRSADGVTENARAGDSATPRRRHWMPPRRRLYDPTRPRTPSPPSTATSTGSPCKNGVWPSARQKKRLSSPRRFCSNSPLTNTQASPSSRSNTFFNPVTTTVTNSSSGLDLILDGLERTRRTHNLALRRQLGSHGYTVKPR